MTSDKIVNLFGPDEDDDLSEIEALESYASQEELLRRAAGVGAAIMLQDAMVTVLTILSQIERLTRESPGSGAFTAYAELLRSAIQLETFHLSNGTIKRPTVTIEGGAKDSTGGRVGYRRGRSLRHTLRAAGTQKRPGSAQALPGQPS